MLLFRSCHIAFKCLLAPSTLNEPQTNLNRIPVLSACNEAFSPLPPPPTSNLHICINNLVLVSIDRFPLPRRPSLFHEPLSPGQRGADGLLRVWTIVWCDGLT